MNLSLSWISLRVPGVSSAGGFSRFRFLQVVLVQQKCAGGADSAGGVVYRREL